MIRAWVQAFDGDGGVYQHDFDATPWFEQASPADLKRLKTERQQSKYDGKPYFFYSGQWTDNIWGWMVESTDYLKRTPEAQSLMFTVDKDDLGWSVELFGEDVDSWMIQKKASTAALGAVDTLLGT